MKDKIQPLEQKFEAMLIEQGNPELIEAWADLKEALLNKVLNVQVSDTTGDDSSNVAGKQLKIVNAYGLLSEPDLTPTPNKDKEALKQVKHGLWQLSQGTHGFEEPAEFSKYVVNKSKELLAILDKEGIDVASDSKPNNQK